MTYCDIPYPLGSDENKHIEFETSDGLIAFDVLDDKADGRHVIRVTACPYLNDVGIFVSGAEDLDWSLMRYGKRLTWPGNYVCESDGEDGTKSMSISQINDQLLSIEMVHNYADGRVETYHVEALINANGSDMYYALSEWFTFQLKIDETTGEKAIIVEQAVIIPSICPELVLSRIMRKKDCSL